MQRTVDVVKLLATQVVKGSRWEYLGKVSDDPGPINRVAREVMEAEGAQEIPTWSPAYKGDYEVEVTFGRNSSENAYVCFWANLGWPLCGRWGEGEVTLGWVSPVRKPRKRKPKPVLWPCMTCHVRCVVAEGFGSLSRSWRHVRDRAQFETVSDFLLWADAQLPPAEREEVTD